MPSQMLLPVYVAASLLVANYSFVNCLSEPFVQEMNSDDLRGACHFDKSLLALIHDACPAVMQASKACVTGSDRAAHAGARKTLRRSRRYQIAIVTSSEKPEFTFGFVQN